MGERTRRPEEMATTSTAIATVAPPLQEEPVEPLAVITLRPVRTQQRERKKVVWTEDTVDNEHMNKKKSKCCCIYEKPHRFGESDSEDSGDECEHCSGHVERRAQHRQHVAAATATATDTQDSTAPAPALSASITLQPNELPPAPARPAPPS